MLGLRKSFSSSKSSAPEYIIAGLGNPGPKHEFTRHNAGFLCLDLFAEKNSVRINKLKNKALYCECKINGKKCLLIKPQTMMNLSGTSIKAFADFYKIPPEKIIIIFDDSAIPLETLRIKRKGSDGGHNGIKSITHELGTQEFPRIKLGIGGKPHPDYDMADWVLSNFSKPDLIKLREVSEKACEAIPLLLEDKFEEAMGKFN